MYVIHNLTSKTIILADLRVEIGPRKVLNLEQVASRSAIDNSRDLKRALAEKRLALTRHSIIEAEKPVERSRVIEKTTVQQIDERQLSRLIKQAVSEELSQYKDHPKQNPNIEKTIQKAIANNMGGLVDSIRDRINNVQVNQPLQREPELSIEPEKLAELSQKSVEKLSGEIETGGQNKAKSVRIINKKSATDLANELD